MALIYTRPLLKMWDNSLSQKDYSLAVAKASSLIHKLVRLTEGQASFTFKLANEGTTRKGRGEQNIEFSKLIEEQYSYSAIDPVMWII